MLVAAALARGPRLEEPVGDLSQDQQFNMHNARFNNHYETIEEYKYR